jgi:hypothetical protein
MGLTAAQSGKTDPRAQLAKMGTEASKATVQRR